MEDLQSSRFEHGCGTIDAQDGTGNKEVVVAGGRYTASVEIYSTSEENWRIGEELNCY